MPFQSVKDSATVEAAGSHAATYAVPAGRSAVGVSNTTEFLRSVRGGRITATATPIHIGRTQHLWGVDIHDDRDRLVARGQLRTQVVDLPG